MLEGQRVRPGLRQLRPEDLPPGVTAARGYDHRGHCVLFEHATLGELGKLVIMNIHEGKMVLHAELCKGQDREESPRIKQKKHVFEQVVATVNNCFDENLPEETFQREALYHRWYPSLLRKTPCSGKPIAIVLFNTNRRRKTGDNLPRGRSRAPAIRGRSGCEKRSATGPGSAYRLRWNPVWSCRIHAL